MPNIDELKTALRKALDAGEDNEVVRLAREITKVKAEQAKADVEKFAKAREELAIAIHKTVKGLSEVAKLVDVGAQGFTYKVDGYPEADIKYKSVALTIPGLKRAGGGGGGGGKTKDEYGMSLGEVFEKFATAEDRAKLNTAASGSAQWQVKIAVKKFAIEQGLLQPTK